MTDDLSTLDNLRPEVREAWQRIVADEQRPEDFECVQAELVRLTRENAEFRRAWDDALLTGTHILKVERIDPATVMLPVESQSEPPK